MAAMCQVHPFISLMLRAPAACTTFILPAQTILSAYSTVTFFCLIVLKATRRRAKYAIRLMFSLGAGLWLMHGGRLTEWLSNMPHSPERWTHAITLWLRVLAIVSTSQLRMQYVPVQRLTRALFAPRLPPGVAYLFAGPLLVVEQLKRQSATIHETQRARGVPLGKGWYQRLRAMPALITLLIHNTLGDLAARGAAPDTRAFQINNRRTTLRAPADSALQRVARYATILLVLAEFGTWMWLR